MADRSIRWVYGIFCNRFGMIFRYFSMMEEKYIHQLKKYRYTYNVNAITTDTARLEN